MDMVRYWLDELQNEQLLGLKDKERRLSPLYSELDALIWSIFAL